MQIQKFNKGEFKLAVFETLGNLFFKAKDVASLLGYKKPCNAIEVHVDKEDKINFNELQKKIGVPEKRTLPKIDPQTIFINESGLYSLILSSKLPKAKEFKHWVTNEVLPSIRKTGQYVHKEVKQKLTLNVQTEADLQKAVVNYLRSKYPHIYFTASLGELQDTQWKRINSFQMGYQKGTPDLLIFYRNKKYTGLAIEFKTPSGTGKVSMDQLARLQSLKGQQWDVVVSNDLFEITERIYAHINLNKLPKPRQKIRKAEIKTTVSITDFIEEETDDDLEEFNLEGLIDHFEEEDEDIADGLRSHIK